MSDITKKAFLATLPPGFIWRPLVEDDYDKLIDGIAENLDVSWDMVMDLENIRDPYKTQWLEELEKEYGVSVVAGSTELERRAQLAARVYELSRWAGLTQLQNALEKAGFTDLIVYHNLPPVNPTVLSVTDYVVNGPLFTQTVVPITCANDTDMFAGEANAVAGLQLVSKNAVTYDADFDIFNAAYWGSDLFTDGDCEDVGVWPDWEMSSGLVNQVTDGGFERSDMTYWAASTGLIAGEKSTESVFKNHRCLKVTSGLGFNPATEQIIQTGVIFPGHQYRVKGAFRSVDGLAKPIIGAASVTVIIGTTSTAWQEFDVLVTIPYVPQPSDAIGLTMDIQGVVAFDDIQVYLADQDVQKSLVDPHAGTRSLEIFERNYLSDPDMENAALQDGLAPAPRSLVFNPDSDMSESTMMYWNMAGGATGQKISDGAGSFNLEMTVANPSGLGDFGLAVQESALPSHRCRIGWRVRGDGSDIVPSIENGIAGVLWTGIPGTTAWQQGGANTVMPADGRLSLKATATTAQNATLEWEYFTVAETRDGALQLLTPLFAAKSLNDKFAVAHSPDRCLQISNSALLNGDFLSADNATGNPLLWNLNTVTDAQVTTVGDRYRCEVTVNTGLTTGNYISQQAGVAPSFGLTRYRLRCRVQKYVSTSQSLKIFMSDGTVLHDAGTSVGWVEIDKIVDLENLSVHLCFGYTDGTTVVANDRYDVTDASLVRIMGLSPAELSWDANPTAGTSITTGLTDATSFDKMGDFGYTRISRALAGEGIARNLNALTGDFYRIAGRYRTFNGGTPAIKTTNISGVGNTVWSGLPTTAVWTKFDVLVTMPAGSEYLALCSLATPTGGGVEWDMVSVVPGGSWEYSKPSTEYSWTDFFVDIGIFKNDVHFQGFAKGDGFTRPQIEDTTGTVLWTGTKSPFWQAYSVDVDRSVSDGVVLTMDDDYGSVYFDDVVLDEIKTVAAYGYPTLQNTFAFTPTVAVGVPSTTVARDYFWFKGWAKGDGLASPIVMIADQIVWKGTPSQTWQEINVYFIASGIPRLDVEHVVKLGADMWYGSVFFDDMFCYKGDITNEGESLVDLFYVGGDGVIAESGQIVSIDTAFVDAEDMDRVREIILRNKPLHTWCGFKVAPTP